MYGKSLEDFRRERDMEVAEFAMFLGISTRTYTQLLQRDPTIPENTLHKVASRLEVAPPAIIECFPLPSSAAVNQIRERLDQADAYGVIVFDPERGEPTEERITLPPHTMSNKLTMVSRVLITFTDGANEDWRKLTHNQREQARRLLRALSISPQGGWFWSTDDRGRKLWIVSSSDTHLVYTIRYTRHDEVVVIASILIFPLPSIHEYEEKYPYNL